MSQVSDDKSWTVGQERVWEIRVTSRCGSEAAVGGGRGRRDRGEKEEMEAKVSLMD